MVKKVTLIFFASWLALLLFMPKAELYYSLEKILAKKDIKLNEKSIEEGLFSLNIKEITVYVKGIPLANIEKLNFFTLFFYSSLTIENLISDETLHTKIPALVKEAHVNHQFFSPMSLSLDANGSFGEIVGDVDLLKRTLYIDFVDTKDIGMIQPSLTKGIKTNGEEGWIYEKSF